MLLSAVIIFHSIFFYLRIAFGRKGVVGFGCGFGGFGKSFYFATPLTFYHCIVRAYALVGSFCVSNSSVMCVMWLMSMEVSSTKRAQLGLMVVLFRLSRFVCIFRAVAHCVFNIALLYLVRSSFAPINGVSMYFTCLLNISF